MVSIVAVRLYITPPAGRKVLVPPHPCQHLVFSMLLCFLHPSHPRGCEVVSHPGFCLHFLNDS